MIVRGQTAIAFVLASWALCFVLSLQTTDAFSPVFRYTTTTSTPTTTIGRTTFTSSPLFVSIGLGPQKGDDDDQNREEDSGGTVLTKTVEYEIPNHEEYRTVRRSKLDEQCDAWFRQLLESNNDQNGVLGEIAAEAKHILTTPVALQNDIEKPVDDPEWTPYLSTSLPWSPLYPAFGLEEFGLPTPRRNAETWRHFDVAGLVRQDYSAAATAAITPDDNVNVNAVREQLKAAGAWLDDDVCAARLVYVNGVFVPQLSKTDKNLAYNMDSMDACNDDEEIKTCLRRLTDGFTDELAAPSPNGDSFQTSYRKLSMPDHNVGDPTTQFAINTQQGTACFAALNTIKTQAVALVNCPAGKDQGVERPRPVLIVQAQTPSGGCNAAAASDSNDDVGVTIHPRTLVIAKHDSRLSIVQSCVDLPDELDGTASDAAADAKPKLYNGYTQIFVHANANVTHSYLEESGGIVTGGVEKGDDEFDKGQTTARQVEAERPSLRDSHLEAIDVHIAGEDGAYEGTIMSVGGCGHVRIAQSVTLLQPGSHATVNGFSLTGGAQRCDVKTNIHHIAAGTTSRQTQKNMIGGRATGAFRGRIRVEQSAQQTDSAQLSRTVLLSDKARAWAVPSLEIIADDVQCAHGATVSDLSEEELFYLRSRGLSRAMSRNLLMYAFAGDISSNVDPAMLGALGTNEGLQKRVIRRLENVVPQGERAVKGEYQSI